MLSPLDGSPLTERSQHVYQDTIGGYLITDTRAMRRNLNTPELDLHTREMRLDNLGIFPLAKNSLSLLERTLTWEDKKMHIEPLLKKSQIPIFTTEDHVAAYIPPEACAICRYFYELWTSSEKPTSEVDPVLAGFAILASYAGI